MVLLLVIMSVEMGSLLHSLPVERRKSVRQLEKVSLKSIKLKCSLFFNRTCLREDILPIYTNTWMREDVLCPLNVVVVEWGHLSKTVHKSVHNSLTSTRMFNIQLLLFSTNTSCVRVLTHTHSSHRSNVSTDDNTIDFLRYMSLFHHFLYLS